MPGEPQQMSSRQHAAEEGEALPLLRSLPPQKVGTLCTVTIVALLAVAWCIVDTWNHDVSSQLFGMGDMKKMSIDRTGGQLNVTSLPAFEYPLTLALMQFAFMGLLFLALWWFTTNHAASDWAKVGACVDKRWGGMVGTHVLGTFWLQSLMVPANMMSLPAFATMRMVDVPAAAVMRGQVMGAKNGGHPLATIGLMSAAAWLLTYSYTQIAECICVFSGHGVALSGIPFFIIFGLMLIMPAANAVCQEAVMIQLQTPPLLMLAMQNILACGIFAPVLLGAHALGWEDVDAALGATIGSQEVGMLVLALCVQMAVLSAVTIGLIYLVDSFWAVAFRSLRVVYYWCKMLFFFYFTSEAMLSVSHPHQSLWSLVMFCGLLMAGAAVVADRKGSAESEGKLADCSGALAVTLPPSKV